MTDITLDDWVAAMAAELGLDELDLDVEQVLDLAGDAAHAVTRLAAPLTTFIAGYAAGQAGGKADGRPRGDRCGQQPVRSGGRGLLKPHETGRMVGWFNQKFGSNSAGQVVV